MMKWVLVLITSVFLFSEEITFRELASLASEDLGTSIYVDKNMTNYTVDFNIPKKQKKGEIYEFFKIVLEDNNFLLQYNDRGNFYFVKDSYIAPTAKPEVIPSTVDRLHYYKYNIKNITNKDVVKVMSIFTDNNGNPLKYTYLEQSDIIAYSCKKRMHNEIKKMLNSSDNRVLSKTVKITLFSVHKNRLGSFGANVQSISKSLNGAVDNIVSSLLTSSRVTFALKDNLSIDTLLFAMKSNGTAKVIQEPIILLSNGVETTIKSALTIPYLSSTTTVEDSKTSTTNNIKYKDVGLQIKINPKIKNSFVYMDLDIISEDVVSIENDKPVTQKISYKSSFTVSKGKPLLLTGIKKQSTSSNDNSVPVLSEIPIIRHLFQKKEHNNESQNINILIEVI